MPSPSDDNPKRDWRLYAQDMDRFAHRAVSYCAELDRAQFEANQLMQDAVLRNIELIGEAATRIPEEIIAMRNQLIHAYLGVDLDVVWDVIQVELPLLILQLKTVLS
ncbi:MULTISPECIES: DUF86 domain-containing protein [unclassified Synechococcus]|uniref:HepT-like ribonuclease domain-containing protein n=1 Tax=unclassified Synechococcus TaxID=2626047 RepID=UPI0021A502A5|nr:MULTISPECIES: DUF86 domain-containing protein [unclassified Synechococcus]MCT0213268.1 DUF86 domain-containing protein [Synechococcus sp. CS-1326]MCT0231919.1 DUF86 domain-containing protein [Synechococcus sp. CS-1327]